MVPFYCAEITAHPDYEEVIVEYRKYFKNKNAALHGLQMAKDAFAPPHKWDGADCYAESLVFTSAVYELHMEE